MNSVAVQLLVFFALFVMAAFFWPTWRLWRRDRVNALVLPRDDTAEGFIGIWFKGVIASIFALLTALAVGLPASAVGALILFDHPIIRAGGWGLLALSLLWVITAQGQMGASWRIGIDKVSRPALVIRGVFGLSRNPIFLGMRLSLLGLFLVLPNAFTLALLLAGEVLMQVQVRLEEEHLLKEYGAEYESYRQAVRRWI